MNNAGIDFEIARTGRLSQLARSMGFESFAALGNYVEKLPYGRVIGNSPVQVLHQHKGTCSSKHALLASICLEAKQADVELTLGIYQMDDRNTPGVGGVLSRHGLLCIPEAHCYLRVAERRFDYTGLLVGATSPFDSLLLEERIDPETIATTKPVRHRVFIDRWSQERGLDPENVWRAREECIEQLSTLSVRATTSQRT